MTRRASTFAFAVLLAGSLLPAVPARADELSGTAKRMNRAFAGAPPSGYVTPVHLVTTDNIQFDGGPNNIFDPDNGYRDQYAKTWGKK